MRIWNKNVSEPKNSPGARVYLECQGSTKRAVWLKRREWGESNRRGNLQELRPCSLGKAKVKVEVSAENNEALKLAIQVEGGIQLTQSFMHWLYMLRIFKECMAGCQVRKEAAKNIFAACSWTRHHSCECGKEIWTVIFLLPHGKNQV